MSARTKKTTSTTVSSTTVKSTGSGTPGRPSAVGTPSRNNETPGRTVGTPGASSSRPASPTMISRLAEKNELASLNDRLASYIDRVRQLEGENSRLTRIIQTQEDTSSKEVVNIKGMYESELNNARRLLDDLAKEKAKLQFENGSLKSEVGDLAEKLRQREKDLSLSEKRVLSAEAQVNDLQAKLSDAINQRRYWEDEYDKLKKEVDTLNKTLAEIKKRLEDETIHRVDLENRIQSLREELAFKKQLYEQELNESVHRSRVVYEETDTRLQADYDSRLRDALAEMRQENEEQLRSMREETELTLEKKLADLRDLLGRSEMDKDKAQSELKTAKKRIDELCVEISRLNSMKSGFEARIRDLENQLKLANEDSQATIDALNAEIRRLRGNLEDQLQEYRDLMDVKIQLDTEISAYRKLLESEETRLNISSSVDTGTPSRVSGGESTRKRKRVEDSSLLGAATRNLLNNANGGNYSSLVNDQNTKADYTIKRKMADVVEITEVNADGKFIKLTNTSKDKDVALGGWQLRQEVPGAGGEPETVTYKFHRSVVLKADQQLTVWSSDAEQTHSPPTDFVMKGHVWRTADNMTTLLVDSKDEEQASCELKRSRLHTSTTKLFSQTITSSSNGNSEVECSEERKNTSKWGWSLFGGSS